ncbi:hypothetical protein NHG92_18835 [Vibrio cholerae]|uniref:hypothetical protein n=1 Tax=Vibrio cholerae TaxID=666 RepID=UPI000F41B986|nr:hypothetical protein [Vibrio cholerae]EGR3959997.1 hypothetical protein [Vibrio cholerae]EGR4411288.1 hypothetical protein [Vibrio cholerae]EJL6984025.1 hypothetical protein [Vibrio cholerae]EKE6109467.1 hypothetical protein [Vibrio cholerae]EKG0005995.1 hypothetical protein [Vibrio cholerae]
MHETLKFLLVLLLIYGVIGMIPLYWASNAKSRLDKVLSGGFLIYYASFTLTLFAVTSSVTDNLSKNEVIELTGLDNFKQYVIMLGFVFTFLFGGVGTNVITDALRNRNEQAEMLAAIKRIENRLESMSVEVKKPEKFSLYNFARYMSMVFFIGSVLYLIRS